MIPELLDFLVGGGSIRSWYDKENRCVSFTLTNPGKDGKLYSINTCVLLEDVVASQAGRIEELDRVLRDSLHRLSLQCKERSSNVQETA